jgi:23S rRNA G2445 N2-methylase RlmL
MVTTIPGIEDIVVKEGSERLSLQEYQLRFGGVGGRVYLKIPRGDLQSLFKMRSIEHIIEIIETFPVERTLAGLEEIYKGVFGLTIPLGSTFRVTCERVGTHDYTSIDVQRAAGQAIVDKYGTKVDLRNPETIVRVDILRDLCVVGIQLTRTSLRIRYPRAFQHPSALNPVIAYAMLRCSEVKPGDRLVDAFCGGGTIIIEAAQVWRDIEAIGLDISPKSVEGARRNSEAANVDSKVRFIRGDATRLEKYLPEGWRADKAVSNLPFGIRSGRKKSLPRIYSGFLRSLRSFLHEESKVCLLTIHKGMLRSIGERLGYEMLDSRQITNGGLTAHIMLFKPS